MIFSFEGLGNPDSSFSAASRVVFFYIIGYDFLALLSKDFKVMLLSKYY